MKRILLIICVGISVYSNAQTKKEKSFNSLRNDLAKVKEDTTAVSVYLDLGLYYYKKSESSVSTRNKDSASLFQKRGEELSKKLSFKKGEARSYILKSKIALQRGQQAGAAELAKQSIAILEKEGTPTEIADSYLVFVATEARVDMSLYLDKALKIYKETNNKFGEAETTKLRGFYLMKRGRIAEGQEFLKKSLVLFKAIGYERVQLIYSMLSIGYNEKGDLKESLEYALKAVALVEKTNDQSSEAGEIYNYTAITYKNLKDLEKSKEYLIKSYRIISQFSNQVQISMLENNIVQTLMNLKKNQEAFVYLKKMEQRYPKLPEMIQGRVAARFVLAYVALKDYEKAKRYVPVITVLAEKMPDNDPGKLGIYASLTKYYLKTEDYIKSRQFAEKLRMLSEKLDNKVMLQQVHRSLFSIDSATSNFKAAIKHYKKMDMLEDSLLSEKKNEQIAELQIKYDTEKKDRNNVILTKQNELQKEKLSKAELVKNIGFVSVLVLLIILGLLYNSYRIKRRSNKLLEVQKSEINHKNETLQELLVEKEWLLKEIHHRVKNNLQIIMSLLNTQSYFLKDAAAMSAIKNSQHRIHSMSLIHKKLYQTDNVKAIDMPTYVNDMIAYFSSSFETGTRIKFDAKIEPVELGITQAVAFGLILNEVVTNSIKHGFPDEKEGTISIVLKKEDERKISLVISDDGVGLGDTNSKNYDSLGMKLISGFSKDLGAQLSIESKNGVIIRLYFENKNISEQLRESKELSA